MRYANGLDTVLTIKELVGRNWMLDFSITTI